MPGWRSSRRTPPVRARWPTPPGWWILHQVGNSLGGEFVYEHAGDVFEEISTAMPQYRGISYEHLEAGSVQWPCTGPGHPGTPILYSGGFARGKGHFLPLRLATA